MTRTTQIQHTNSINLETHKELFVLTKNVKSFVPHWDKEKLFLIHQTRNNPLKQLDLVTGNLKTPIQFEGSIQQAQFTSDNLQMVIIMNKRIRVFKVPGFGLLHEFKLHCGTLESFVFADKSCQEILLNANMTGLHLVNIQTKKVRQMHLYGFFNTWPDNLIMCSKHRVLYGVTKTESTAAYSLKRLSKFKVFVCHFKRPCAKSSVLTRDDKILFTGDGRGRLTTFNSSSSKIMSSAQLESKSLIKCLQVGCKLLYGGTLDGELLVMQSFSPFSVLYYQKVSRLIFSVKLTGSCLVVAGVTYDPVLIYKKPEIDKCE